MPIQRDRGGWETDSSCQMSKHGPIGSWPESRDKGRERIISKGPLQFEKEMEEKKLQQYQPQRNPGGCLRRDSPWGCPPRGLCCSPCIACSVVHGHRTFARPSTSAPQRSRAEAFSAAHIPGLQNRLVCCVKEQ